LQDAGYNLVFRLPNSFDLAAIARLPSLAAARQALAERCVVNADYEGVAVHGDALPERMLDLMASWRWPVPAAANRIPCSLTSRRFCG
jgi:hypothetical protein